ncbi:MAG: dihydroorotate dehydrogenase [Kiritimatiellia bacterium]|jgi:dihydroorotate dehydrogenase
MIYSLYKKAAFKMNPELVHTLTLKGLKLTHRRDKRHFLSGAFEEKPVELMGLTFPNAIGLAAGMDKNGDYIDALGGLGFGFIEIGTITPRPQPGNPKPRLFRIPEQEAIINRMGFNNKGVEHLCNQVKRTRYKGILGINIGKNFDTPNENAADDYLKCMDEVFHLADYITVNISSPNTKGLRDLQEGQTFNDLLSRLKAQQDRLNKSKTQRVPMLIKIAPDLNADELHFMAQCMLDHNIDGVIATNTTIKRDGLEQYAVAKESGGLSGFPLQDLSTHVIRQLYAILQDRIPIIGVGGIMDGAAAKAKLDAGAKLVQVYSGLIYRGPGIVPDIARNIGRSS